ncbi:uncharacterized protein LOC128862140 [Anastrepha ludens]|uniref:uncharacterized protein LOC128862140 n=1 Tax=Anastrepha ludens TaxID=28586 RepID=UPI0023AFCAEF|nr:uncharacterized protein LOC128862140 [Anastrepha ludens]
MQSKVYYTSTTDSSTAEELIPATTIKAMEYKEVAHALIHINNTLQNGTHLIDNIVEHATVSLVEDGKARDDLNKSQEMKNYTTKREGLNEITKMPPTTAASFVDKEILTITTTSRSAATEKITTNTLVVQSDVVKNEKTLLKTATTKGDLIKFTTPLPIINISTHKTTMDETTTEAMKHIEISSARNINCALQPCIDNATCMLADLCECAPGYTWYEPISGSGDQMQPMCAAIVEHGSNDVRATLGKATDEIIADEEAYPAEGSIINVTDKIKRLETIRAINKFIKKQYKKDVITNDHEDSKLIYSIIGGCAIFVALIILLTYFWRKHI